MEFNEQQKQIINYPIEQPNVCAVMASAGSGKSTTLVGRVEHLIASGVNPADILVLTFSNKSGKDLKRKLLEKEISDVTAGTYHALALKVLMDNNINILKTMPQFKVENLFRQIDRSLKPVDTSNIISWIGYQKNHMVNADSNCFYDKETGLPEYVLQACYQAYEREMKAQKCYDFDDWLLELYNGLKNKKLKFKKYKYMLVDECQDLNKVQYKLIPYLCSTKNIMLIGDFKQQLYAFRGSSIDEFYSFMDEHENAEILFMDTNYRSCKNLIEGANRLAREYYSNSKYYSDAVSDNKKDGIIRNEVFYDNEDQAKFVVDDIESKLKAGVKPNDIAVIYRLNKNSFEIEQELKSRGINYFTNSDTTVFQRKELATIIAMLRLIKDKGDDVAFLQILNARYYPCTFLRKSVVEDIENYSAMNNISMYDASCRVTVKPQEASSLQNLREIISTLAGASSLDITLPKLIENIITLFRMEESIKYHYSDEELDDRLTSLETFKRFAEGKDIDKLLKVVYEGDNTKKKKKGKDDIELMTVHKSKGLEWKITYVINCNDMMSPKETNILNSVNCAYVAFTRAKEELIMTSVSNSMSTAGFCEEYLGGCERINNKK